MKSGITVLLFSLLFFGSAAQKNKGPHNNLGYGKKIIGTWILTKYIEAENGNKETIDGSVMSITYTFQANGECTFKAKVDADDGTMKGQYKISHNQSLIITGDEIPAMSATIDKLNNTELILYTKEVDSTSHDVHETWMHLKKNPDKKRQAQSTHDYAKKIIGKWELIKTQIIENGNKEVDEAGNFSMTFFLDGKINIIAQSAKQEQDTTVGTYEIIGDKIIYNKGTDDENETQIETLTSSALILKLRKRRETDDLYENFDTKLVDYMYYFKKNP